MLTTSLALLVSPPPNLATFLSEKSDLKGFRKGRETSESRKEISDFLSRSAFIAPTMLNAPTKGFYILPCCFLSRFLMPADEGERTPCRNSLNHGPVANGFLEAFFSHVCAFKGTSLSFWPGLASPNGRSIVAALPEPLKASFDFSGTRGHFQRKRSCDAGLSA